MAEARERGGGERETRAAVWKKVSFHSTAWKTRQDHTNGGALPQLDEVLKIGLCITLQQNSKQDVTSSIIQLYKLTFR